MATQATQTFHWQEDDDDLDDENFEIKGSTLIYITILFCIIIIVTFCFFLYSRCIARSRATASSSDVSRTSTMLLSQPQRGLDAAKINSIPITVHRSMENNETLECSICLGVFDDGVKVKVLPRCCHRYHCECVDKWLITHSSCPICRTTVQVDDSPV